MTPELQNIIGSIIQQLATWTGQTVETISSNLPSFLKAYAWYDTLHGIHWEFILTFALCLAIAFIISLFVIMIADAYRLSAEQEKKIYSTYAKISLISSFVIAILFTLIPIITTAIVPEMVGLKALIELIKTMG